MPIAIAAAPIALRVDESGTIRIGSTRVTLDTLVACFQEGNTPEQIAQDFPTLDLADIYGAIGYYLRHQQELDAYLAKRTAEAEEFEKRNPHLFARGVRERLLVRREKAQAGN